MPIRSELQGNGVVGEISCNTTCTVETNYRGMKMTDQSTESKKKSLKKHELPQLNWNIRNMSPYIIGASVPTVLLVLGMLPPVWWASIWILLIVGVGLVDINSMKIAGSEIDFDDNEDST